MEFTKFDVSVLLKHYWKQDYRLAAAARKIYEVEGEGVVSECVVQCSSTISTLKKKTLKICHVLEDLNYTILRIYVEIHKKNKYS